MKERINLIIENLGISKNQFAKELGTSSAMVSKITTKEINFGVDIAEKIIRTYPSINPVWLLTGVGEMLISTTNNNTQLNTQAGTQFADNNTTNSNDSEMTPEEVEKEWEVDAKRQELGSLLTTFENKFDKDLIKENPKYAEIEELINNLYEVHYAIGEILRKLRDSNNNIKWRSLLYMNDNDVLKMDVKNLNYEAYKANHLKSLENLYSLKPDIINIIPELEQFINFARKA